MVELFSDFGFNWIIRARYFQLKDKYEKASYVSTLLFISLITRLFLTGIIFFSKEIIFIKIFDTWSPFYSYLLNIQIGIFLLSFMKNTVIPILILEMSTKKYLVLTLSAYLFQASTSLFLLIQGELGIASIFYGELLGAIIFSILATIFLKDYFTLKLNPHVYHDLINIGLPAVPKLFIGQFQNNLNKYFIQIYMTPYDLGIFQKSDFLYGGFKGLQKSLGNAVSPKNLKKITKNQEDSETGIIITQFLYFISLLVLFATFFLEDIFKLMGVNEAFWVCAKYAPLYGCNVLISSFTIMFRHNIIIAQKTKFFIFSSIISLTACVLSAIILIPIYGIIGGIFSVIIVSSFSAIATIIYSQLILCYNTKINYLVWIFLLSSTLILYTMNYNGYFETELIKISILSIFTIIIGFIDFFWIGSISWKNLLINRSIISKD